MNTIFPLLFFIITFLISPACLAQKKTNQSSWFSLTTYDAGSMEVNNKTAIKNVNNHLIFACIGGDPISTKERWEKDFSSTDISVDLEDGPSDSNGRVLAVTISVKLRINSAMISEEKFYRNKNDCMKEKESLKKWLTEKNAEYRSTIEKYK